METEDLGSPNANKPLNNPVERDAEDDTPVNDIVDAGVDKCPTCERIFGTQEDFDEHRIHPDEHCRKLRASGEPHSGESKFPDLPDMDDTLPAHFTPLQPETFPITGSVKVHVAHGYREAYRVDGLTGSFDDSDRFYVAYTNAAPVGVGVVAPDGEVKVIHSSLNDGLVNDLILNKIESHYDYLYMNVSDGPNGWVNVRRSKWVKTTAKEPKDLLEAAIPFVYDIAADDLQVGSPGQKTADIQGDFTPGGIVEGEYDKGGKVTIYTSTNMPYSVNHLLSLWYNVYPDLIIKNVFLDEGSGQMTKLASE
jgi:hypothetical protein